MSFLEVEYAKLVFFECYKINENIQSIGSWYCICHQYSGCQEVHNFNKERKEILLRLPVSRYF